MLQHIYVVLNYLSYTWKSIVRSSPNTQLVNPRVTRQGSYQHFLNPARLNTPETTQI